MNRFPRLSSTLRTVALLAALVLLNAGCITRQMSDWAIGASYEPSNIHSTPHQFSFRRVGVLPLFASDEEGQRILGPVVPDELAKTKRFEIVPVDPGLVYRFSGRKALNTIDPVPLSVLHTLKEQLGCDAVLFTELTQFKAYPPLVIGWRFKLVDAWTGEVTWAADETFDAGNKLVSNGARRYQLGQTTVPGPLEDSHFILLTPRRFGHYSANAVLSRLPAQVPLKFSQLAPIQ